MGEDEKLSCHLLLSSKNWRHYIVLKHSWFVFVKSLSG
jgi:hypothetical protein